MLLYLKKSYKNNRFKTSGPTWNVKLKLTDESYSVSDIEDQFKCTIKKHETYTDNPLIRISVHQTQNKTTLD